MKKTNLLMVAVLFWAALMNGICHAAEPKEPKLIKETKFTDKIKKFADDVVVTEKEVIFLDAQGNMRKKKALPSHATVNLSKDGTRMGLRMTTEVGVKEPGKTEFRMLDENGEVLWEKNIISPYTIYISQAKGGSVVEDECHESGCGKNLRFYDKQNLKGKVVTADVGSDLSSVEGDMSDDGNYFIANYSSWRKGSDLVLFDISGEQLWAKHFENDEVFATTISMFGNYVISYSRPISKQESYIYIFNKQGDLLLKQQVEYGDYNFKFEKNERYVVAYSKSGTLYMFDTTPKLLWEYSIVEKNAGFLHADVSSGFIVASGTIRNPKNASDRTLPRYMYVFNVEGNLLSRKQFADHGYLSWNKGPEVKLKDAGKKIIVRFPDRLAEFENEFAK